MSSAKRLYPIVMEASANMPSNNLFRAMELMRDVLRVLANFAREVAYTEKEHGINFKDMDKFFTTQDPTQVMTSLIELKPEAQLALLSLVKNLTNISNNLDKTFIGLPAEKLALADTFDEIAKQLEDAVGHSKTLSKPVDMDSQLLERCNNKDYHDTITNAFSILEDRIRIKTGETKRYGSDLIDFAFNPKTGKLILGNSDGEKEGVYFLMKGAFLCIRNAPSHTMNATDSRNAAIKVLYTADYMLKMIDKATIRT